MLLQTRVQTESIMYSHVNIKSIR